MSHLHPLRYRAIPWLALVSTVCAITACSEKPPSGWTGYAEGDYVFIASPIAGRLQTLAVQAGQQVQANAPLFTLEQESEQAAQAEAQARLRSARAQASNTEKGRRAEEIAVTTAQLQQAQAALQLARQDVTRQQQLVAQGFVAKARVEDAQTALTQAQSRVAELTAALQVARLPARVDERTAATATAQAASEALRQAQWRIDQKSATAPQAAQVSEVYFRPGEFVGAGVPVVALLPPQNIKARFYVPESDLSTLRLGQTVQIHCDGCGAAIPARVSRIATQPEYAPPIIYSNTQRSRLVFLVEARADAADAPRLHPGQPVDVRP